MSTKATIRTARPSDDEALSKICLLTGAAGLSAVDAHSIPVLLGLLYALPYNRLETTFGFVLVDDGSSEVVGYVLGTTDTERFEQVAEQEWWPPLRLRYEKTEDPSRTPADNRLISAIHSPYKNPADITSRYPAHIHIDILPSHQGKSYGRKLMASAVEFLRGKGHSGLFVGLDPANNMAKSFYARLGFERLDKDNGEWWALNFDQFTGSS
ncbi:acyl-CoA N-acyltransferase [Hysterangium stoloniferum]|nr:acyl-CoA N-acyltransferase [Hysterangium stoloniferum]